jgi:hypothetical protein
MRSFFSPLRIDPLSVASAGPSGLNVASLSEDKLAYTATNGATRLVTLLSLERRWYLTCDY